MAKGALPAPNWSRERIISAANRLTKEFEDRIGRDHIQSQGQRFEEVHEKLLYPKFGIHLSEGHKLGFDSSGQKILGVYDIRENTAKLDEVLDRARNDARRVFTLYHEVAGHGALQGKWLRAQLHELEFLEVTDISISEAAEMKLELQANLFASHFAAPAWLVNFAVKKIFKRAAPFEYTGPCEYWLTTAGGLSIRKYVTDVYDLCGWIGSKIDQFFGGLSGQALGYRLVDCGWINDKTGTLKTSTVRRPLGLFRAQKGGQQSSTAC